MASKNSQENSLHLNIWQIILVSENQKFFTMLDFLSLDKRITNKLSNALKQVVMLSQTQKLNSRYGS